MGTNTAYCKRVARRLHSPLSRSAMNINTWYWVLILYEYSCETRLSEVDWYRLTSIFSERARLAPPWPLTSSHLNTPSFYCLLDLSSFSSLSTFFLYFRFLRFSFFVFFVLVYTIRKANRQQQLIRIFPSTADSQPCDVPLCRLYHF